MKPPKGVGRWLKQLSQSVSSSQEEQQGQDSRKQQESLDSDILRNMKKIEKRFARTDDLVIRPISDHGKTQACVIYITAAASSTEVSTQVVEPMVRALTSQIDRRKMKPANLKEAITAARVTQASTFQDVAEALVNGRCVVLIQGESIAQIVWVEGWRGRNIDVPQTEPAQNGPVEGFTENLADNFSLIRRRLRSEKLRIEEYKLGHQSNTPVAIVYMENLAREEIVQEVRKRLDRVKLDSIVDINYIKELILDDPWSPWPNFIVTERPDRTVAHLVEGHVAVLVDGTPWVLLVPVTVNAMMQSPDDYYVHFYPGTFTRYLRWISTIVALLAPSLYVSLLSYHHELIPSSLVFTIISSRERIPLPPFLEALAMESAFEILREAGLRMPQQIGPALSIVGGLVIGEAAVRAGLVSPLMIVVVGMTAIATFVIPSRDFNNSIRLLRFPALIMAGMLGLFGVLVYLMFIVALLLRMRSFGVPLLFPFVPIWPKGIDDSMMRTPWWRQRFRPWPVVRPDAIRSQPDNAKPPSAGVHDKERSRR